MKNKLSIRRVHLMAGLAIVLSLLSIRLAFWNTVQAWQLNRQLNQQLNEGAISAVPTGYQERKNTNLSKLIARYQADSATYRSNMLTAISTLAEKEKVKIISVPSGEPDPYFQTIHYRVYKVEVEGAYPMLTRFYFQLQVLSNIGMVRSAQYVWSNERSTSEKERKLRLNLYLETAR